MIVTSVYLDPKKWEIYGTCGRHTIISNRKATRKFIGGLLFVLLYKAKLYSGKWYFIVNDLFQAAD
jgi:hypothetical protein